MIRRAAPTIVFLLLAAPLGAALAEDSRHALDQFAGATFGATDTRCPFSFQGGMSPGVFCVYDGVAVGAGGQTCTDRVLVIWTRLAPESDPAGPVDEDVTDRSGVYFGFVPFPELVVRAGGDADARNRATIIDYTLAPHQPRVRLQGSAEMRFVAADGGEGTEILSLRMRGPVLAAASCAVTSYDGTFVGVMTVPPEPIP